MTTVFHSRLFRRAGRFAGALLVAVVVIHSRIAIGQPAPASEAKPANAGPAPFGANLFLGNFHKQSGDGRNPDYRVMPGDRVAVNTWGTVASNGIYVIDGQGNIFLPKIGPIRLGGVKNEDLTEVVKKQIARIYRRNFDVYINLLTAAPVAVFVTGGVERPGRYAGVPSDSVLFFLDQAGGIDAGLGSYRNIKVLRNNRPLAEIDLYDFVLRGQLPAVQFADGDTVLVGQRGPVVEILGEVASPAFIEFEPGKHTGADALAVLPKAALATAVTIGGVRGERAFHRTLSVKEFRTEILLDGDSVHFRRDGRAETIVVRLAGEFDSPSMMSVKRGSRLVDVLNHVKVDPVLSDLRSIHLRRPSVAAAQKKSINDSLFRLERSALLALSATDREASIRAKEAELMKSFIHSARLIQPLGRIVTSKNGKPLNLLLMDGDTIVIPANTNVVRVSGEVQMAQAVVFSPGLRAEDYVRLAGGYTQRSERDKVIILHASAAVTMSDAEAQVSPGDEILVPPRVDSKLLQNASDVTQVLYQIAVAAAVVLAL